MSLGEHCRPGAEQAVEGVGARMRLINAEGVACGAAAIEALQAEPGDGFRSPGAAR